MVVVEIAVQYLLASVNNVSRSINILKSEAYKYFIVYIFVKIY